MASNLCYIIAFLRYDVADVRKSSMPCAYLTADAPTPRVSH